MEAHITHCCSSYAPKYKYNNVLNCIEISYSDKIFIIDTDSLCLMLNFGRKFIFCNENEYPYYSSNNKLFNLVEFLYKFSYTYTHYNFLNGNKFDLRKSNVQLFHNFNKHINENYNVLKYIQGHYNSTGIDAHIMKNPIWITNEEGKEIYIMYCEKSTLIKLCEKSYQNILDFEDKMKCKFTWYKGTNGYILSHLSSDRSKIFYIHQVITGCYGNGKGTSGISVDHIDQNPLNNTYENLRIATRKEQEQNSKGIKSGTKRERQRNAQALPEGITHDMLPKYIVYYKNWLNKERTKYREYFRIERHPILDEKCWETTKSDKISIQEKLQDAIRTIQNLDRGILPQREEPILPKYLYFTGNVDEKQYLAFERRIDNKRLNLQMTLPKNYILEEQVKKMDEKIVKKYGTEYSIFIMQNENNIE